MIFTAIDFEMPNNFSPKICAYGYAVIEDGKITQTRGGLVDPHTWFDRYVVKITGITQEAVCGEPTFPEIWDELRQAIERADAVVAHNAGSDLTVLSRCLHHYGISWKDTVKYICTYETAKVCYPDAGKLGLKGLCEMLDIPLDNHNAISDSLGCARLLINYMENGLQPHKHILSFDMAAAMIDKKKLLHRQKEAAQRLKTEQPCVCVNAPKPKGRIRTGQIQQQLLQLCDGQQREEDIRRLPDIAPERILGVPQQQIYDMAQQITQSSSPSLFFCSLPHRYHEEDTLHVLLLSMMENKNMISQQAQRFLPFLDNYETAGLLFSLLTQRKIYLCPGITKLSLYDARKNPYAYHFALEILLSIKEQEKLFLKPLIAVINAVPSDGETAKLRELYLYYAAFRYYKSSLQRLRSADMPYAEAKAMLQQLRTLHTAKKKKRKKKKKKTTGSDSTGIVTGTVEAGEDLFTQGEKEPMLYTIENEKIKVTVCDLGAEIVSLQAKETGFEYIWQGDPDYWTGHAYNLFPICGRLWEGKYTYGGTVYEMNLHGFIRRSTLRLLSHTQDSISFEMKENEMTLSEYPFRFTYTVTYTLDGAAVTARFHVVDTDDKELIFTLGGHPGFNLPMEEGLCFEDYYVQFPAGGIKLLEMTPACFVTGNTPDYPLEEGNIIRMRHSLFDVDAVFLCNVPKTVELKSDKGSRSVRLTYEKMNYLGLWHKPGTAAPYVCIEPWLGVPSTDGEVDKLETKRDTVHLAPGEEYDNAFTIEVQ